MGARTYLYKQTQTRELTVTFDKIKGNHDFKFGVDYRQYPDNQISGSNATDLTLSFGTTFTNGPLDNSPASPRGQGMASFLYGIPTSGSLQIPAASNFADSSWLYAPFFQDSWKVTPQADAYPGREVRIRDGGNGAIQSCRDGLRPERRHAMGVAGAGELCGESHAGDSGVAIPADRRTHLPDSERARTEVVPRRH